MIFRTIALLALAAVLVACGSSAPSAAAVPSLRPTAGTAASGPSAIPSPSGPTDSPEPSVDSHGVPDLEALLPRTVGGVALERYSLTGKDFYATGTPETQQRLDTFLGILGKTVADLRVGDAGDPSGRAILDVGAFQVVGAKPEQLLSEWVSSTQAAHPGQISVSSTTIGGRALTKLIDGTREVGATTYAYVQGDTIFLVGADDVALVTDAIAQLPKP